MNPDTLQALFDSKKWHFAKTMPTIPHFYTRRSEWGNDAEFETVVAYLRRNSVPEKFYSKTFHYFHMNGWKYWTMGEPLHKTQVINMAKP